MKPARGDIWLANLDPIRGSEQAGARPVLVLQNDSVNAYTSTYVAVPLTTNLRRASLPTCVKVSAGEGGLSSDSVVLCHQIRVLDKDRLFRKLGSVRSRTLVAVEGRILYTLGIV
jgi:mRNA interferase MazF